jgi:hypothetical protein
MIHLRRSRSTDVEATTGIIKNVLEQENLPNVCSAQIRDDSRVLGIAEESSDVVGFASAFLTTGSDRSSPLGD